MKVVRPESLDAAIKLVKEDEQLKLVSGGTDLIPRLNQRLEKHESLCFISPYPELTGVRRADGRIFIGACTRLAEIDKEPILQENRCMYFNNQVPWSDVNHCFKWGGAQCFQYPKSKVCMALFQSDVAPVLIAYGAAVRIRGSEGEREMPVEQLYLSGGKKNLKHDEILTGVLIQEARETHRCAYVRWTLRGSFDFPLLGCVVSMDVREGCASGCRIVFGAAGVKPQSFAAGEEAFEGKSVSELPEIAKSLHEEAAKKIMGFTDTHVDTATRKEKAGWLLEDALKYICK